MTSIHWNDQDSSVLCTRRACRELSLFDIHSIQARTLATLPYFIDMVLPCRSFIVHLIKAHMSSCYFVSMADGKLKQIDCRIPNKCSSKWTIDSIQRRAVSLRWTFCLICSCMSLSECSPFELVVTYKNPASMDRFDLRNTSISPLSGIKTPHSLSSHLLHFPNDSHVISMHPFLTEVVLHTLPYK